MLAAAARVPDHRFAAWDPHVLDRRLRAERDEHSAALAAGPTDQRYDRDRLARRVDQLETEARRCADAVSRAEHFVRSTAGPYLRRSARDAHRIAVGSRDRAADHLADIHDELRSTRAELREAETAVALRRRWDRTNQWHRDEVDRIDTTLAHHWADTVLQAAREDDPLAHGLGRLRHAAGTLVNDPAQARDYELLRSALERCRIERIDVIYRGSHVAPPHLRDELGPLPEPGPARAAWCALALSVEERHDLGKARNRDISLLERRLVRLGGIDTARLIDLAHDVPVDRLVGAGPEEWTAVLDAATTLHHRQARTRAAAHDLGISL